LKWSVAVLGNLFRYGFEFDCLSAEARQQISKAGESLPPYEGGW
jgi:hypothetical protein